MLPVMNTKTKLFLAFFFIISKIAFSQNKHALIVAIGNYPDPDKNGWPLINSANDVPLIKNALINQQFAEQDIHILLDSQATKKGIVTAMDDLIAGVKNGDVVVIHFSTHGEQIEDDNGDEMDGYDETIVPYGAVYSFDPKQFEKASADYLRDDLFGDKITQLRNKLGKNGDVLVIIDACHSGSGTRGIENAKIRGGMLPMVSDHFNKNNVGKVDEAGVFKENAGTKLNQDAATYVLISGAQAKESNYECVDDNKNPVGSLSYSFSKSISSLNGSITYRGLFAMIENIMREKAPKQRPVLEGDGIDRELFGGKYEKQQPYFTISKNGSNNTNIVLNAGFVAGITKGSVINFFAAGTTTTLGKKPLNTGKVTNVASFTAAVKLDNPDDNLAKQNPWAFISELSYGAVKLRLFVNDINGAAKMVQDSLKDFQLVEFNSVFDLSLDTSGAVNNWALKYPNTGTVFMGGFDFSDNRQMESLRLALKRFDRFRYLQGLQFNEEGLSAKIELVFLDEKGNIDSGKLKLRTRFGRLELKENDQVYLRIINTGSKQFYINIVDIQPDGIINPILPNKNVKDRIGNPAPIKWEDCLVKKLDTLFLRNVSIGISGPYGEETFKVFLSSSPLDLEDILTTSTEKEALNKRGALNGLEKIFVNSNVNKNGRRGAGDMNVNTDQNGTIFSLNFQILPK